MGSTATVASAPDAVTTGTDEPREGLRALVFPGQGSQREGMARPWQDTPHAQKWTQAGEVLGWDVARLGTTATADELRDPVHCQVALYVHGAVLFDAWSAGGNTAHVTAGHSLGEYNALLAAGVLTFEDGLRLVEQRARATAAAAAQHPGGMVACLGGDSAAARDACLSAGASVANDNADGQLVVAGDEAALKRFTAAMADSRSRVVRLEVGAAYHSPAMAPAVEALVAALHAATWHDARIPVVSNVDAQPHQDAGEWASLLAAQLTAPVRWRETMLCLQAMGATEIVELGASPVLTGLAKRTTPALRRRCVTEPADLETT